MHHNEILTRALRYDKICREVREKEDLLTKIRLELDSEVLASGASASEYSAPMPSTKTPTAAVSRAIGATVVGEGRPGATPMPTSVPTTDSSGADSPARAIAANESDGARRDAPWVLETLGLSQASANVIRASITSQLCLWPSYRPVCNFP